MAKLSQVVSIGVNHTFKVIFTPLEYILSIPPLSSYVINICLYLAIIFWFKILQTIDIYKTRDVMLLFDLIKTIELSSNEYWEFRELKYKILNSGIREFPFYFLDWDRTRSGQSWITGIRRDRKWLVLSARYGKFPAFVLEKSGFREMHSET